MGIALTVSSVIASASLAGSEGLTCEVACETYNARACGILASTPKHPMSYEMTRKWLLPMRTKAAWNRYYPMVSWLIRAHFGDTQCLSIVEVGTCYGGLARHLVESLPSARLTAVDPTLSNFDKADSTSYHIEKFRRQHSINETEWSRIWAESLFLSMRDPRFGGGFGERYHMVHARSHDAAPFFKDGSLDVVFIDGDHRYDSVVADITDYVPKVRDGGLVIFNDYVCDGQGSFPGVNRPCRN